jgi:hypothetical protein
MTYKHDGDKYEASDVRWVAPGDLEALDIHPTQWRQLRDWLTRAWPHVDSGRSLSADCCAGPDRGRVISAAWETRCCRLSAWPRS